MTTITRKTETTLERFSVEDCDYAFKRHSVDGEGCKNIAAVMNVKVSEANRLIDAGRELDAVRKAWRERSPRVWIELEKPPFVLHNGEKFEAMTLQCTLVNIMLQRLGVDVVKGRKFFVLSTKRGLTYAHGGHSGFTECADNGEWFNLQFLAGNPDADL